MPQDESAGDGAEPMIELHSVRRTFRGPDKRSVVALQLDELILDRGEGLAVTGPNGSGKTTLLHLVAGLLRPQAGEVVVAGQDLSRLREHQLDRFRARHVGYLVQGGSLMESLSAVDNVALALMVGGCPARERRRRALERLERVGVAHRAAHRPGELSGGERQRVALARALANDPPLILADEPTAALDAEGAAAMVEILDQLRRRDGRTLVVVTHRPDEVPPGLREMRLPRRVGSAPPDAEETP